MGYYLADFIKIGATFVPLSHPTVLSKDCLLFYGCLRYRNDEVKVAVKTKKGGVSKIVRTIGLEMDGTDGSEEAIRHRDTLRQIHKDAIKLNINGLRDCVRIRTFYLIIWFICMILLVGCLGITVLGILFKKKVAFLFLLVINGFLIYSLYKNRWRIIPFGCIRGVSYGVKL